MRHLVLGEGVAGEHDGERPLHLIVERERLHAAHAALVAHRHRGRGGAVPAAAVLDGDHAEQL